jgi:two-component system response regulator VicR
MNSMKILLVDDDEVLARALKRSFTALGHDVVVCPDGNSVLDKVGSESPSMVILDVMLPGKDGFSVLRELRERYPDLPVIMLTARSEDIDKVLGLEMGADDYLAKPFNVRELEARVKAVSRRAVGAGKAQVRRGEFLLDLQGRRVWKGGRELGLSAKEFDVFAVFLKNPGLVFTREALLEKCWGYDYLGDSRAVDILISRLREKVEDDPQKPRVIHTKRGVGYYCE